MSANSASVVKWTRKIQLLDD